MDQLAEFCARAKKEETMILATSANGSVTMRTVSPVSIENGVLIFTSPDSLKYQQLRKNPVCCIAVGGYFGEVRATFLGHTMLEENTLYREMYSEKFNDAFAENAAFGGQDAEFILLLPIRLKGWVYEDNTPSEPFEYNCEEAGLTIEQNVHRRYK